MRSRLWVSLACALTGLALVARFWKCMTLDPIGLISALGAGAALASYYPWANMASATPTPCR